MSRVHCQFCGMLHAPHPSRKPSLTCTPCWLEIQAALSQPEPQFSRENARKINFEPPVYVIQ